MLEKALMNTLFMAIQLLAIIDPTGAIPLLAPVLAQADERTLRKIDKLVGLGVPSILILFAVAGQFLLQVFSIRTPDLEIAGGIILLIVSIDILREGYPKTASINVEEFVFVPIITPMLVGPGAITAVLVMRSTYPLWQVVLSILIASGVTFIVIKFSQKILRRLGEDMLKFIGRFMSLIVAGWSVSLIIQGIREVVRTFHMC
ncbi:MAG: MarC family protein [Crenarchaeota archaeon]|nr:MarC family protein [Thermoproteota archaeon]